MKYSFSRTRRPGTLRKLAGALGLLLALGLLVMSSVPALGESLLVGHMFFGSVTVNGSPAPDGAVVEAKIADIVYNTQATVEGKYGYAAAFWVPADDPETPVKEGGSDGDTVEFFVNGAAAGSYEFHKPKTGGYETQSRLDLVATGEPVATYVLTVTSSGCCTVTVEDEYVVIGTVGAGATDNFTLNEGTVVTLTANDGETCRFDGWTVDGAACADNPTTVTMNGPHTIVAACTAVEPVVAYDLTVVSDGCCEITVEYDSVVGTVGAYQSWTIEDLEPGTIVTLTACEVYFCEFCGWKIDGVAATGNPITVTMEDDHTALAVGEPAAGSILSIPLVEGWNTFSTPIALHSDMDTWCEFITVNSLDVGAVLSWDGALQVWTNAGDCEPLKPLTGYYIYMNAAGVAEIVPNSDPLVANPPPVKHLSAGLNLVGIASLENQDVVTALSSVYNVTGGLEGYVSVINPAINPDMDWDNNLYNRNDPNLPTMQIAKAYWVFMLNSGDLVGSTTTPLDP